MAESVLHASTDLDALHTRTLLLRIADLEQQCRGLSEATTEAREKYWAEIDAKWTANDLAHLAQTAVNLRLAAKLLGRGRNREHAAQMLVDAQRIESLVKGRAR